MRKKHNWPQVIEDWRASGQSKFAFCKAEGITYPSFLMHLKRTEQLDNSGFQQIQLQNSSASDRIDFYYLDGRCVCFQVSTPKEVIRFLVAL